MSLNKKKKQESTEASQHGRRSFLKKTAYAAPTLIALGGLVKPTKAQADFGGPPSDPNGNGNW